MTRTNGQAPSIAPPTHKLTRKEEATWPLTKVYGQLTSANQRQPLVSPQTSKSAYLSVVPEKYFSTIWDYLKISHIYQHSVH